MLIEIVRIDLTIMITNFEKNHDDFKVIHPSSFNAATVFTWPPTRKVKIKRKECSTNLGSKEKPIRHKQKKEGLCEDNKLELWYTPPLQAQTLQH